MPGTGYTSVGDYLAANQGTLANERAGLGSDIASQYASAQGADNAVLGKVTPGSDYSSIPGYLDALQGEQNVVANAQNLGTESGLAATLQGKYGATDPGYTPDKSSFDASLLTGSPQLGAAASQAQTLDGYLNSHAAKLATPPPSTPPASGPSGIDSTPSGEPRAIDPRTGKPYPAPKLPPPNPWGNNPFRPGGSGGGIR